MKKLNILAIVCLFATAAHAQVGIGTVSPNSTLDVRGSLSAAVRSFTSATTLATTDHTAIFTGTTATTVTLPDASGCAGRMYSIKNFSATSPTPLLTVATSSSQKIDGYSTWLLDESNETITITSDGSNWIMSAHTSTSGGTGSSWNEGGNAVASTQSLGTTTAYDLPFITSNTERMRITSAGLVGIGSTAFSAKPEALLVYQNNSSSYNVIGGKGNLNNYLQLNIQNKNGGTSASSDLVATADNGTETNNYVDLGINSSGYSPSGITGGADNAYLYSTGNDFVIGNGTNGKNLIFFTGGTATTDEQMRITATGNVGIATTTPQATLDVSGTVKVGAAGSVLNSIIRFTNQSVTDLTSITYNQTTTETLTLSGVSKYATVIVNPRSTLAGGLVIAYAYASAANTVQIVINNASGNTLSLGTVAFDITVIQ